MTHHPQDFGWVKSFLRQRRMFSRDGSLCWGRAPKCSSQRLPQSVSG